MVMAKKKGSKKSGRTSKKHRHRYGGYEIQESSVRSGERAVLVCAKCGEEYVPASAFWCEPIGQPIYDCPHPVFGPSRWHKEDPFVRSCLVCGAAKRFTPTPYVGGPCDGEIDLCLITPEDGTSAGSWRYNMTTRGQEPDAEGLTTTFSYALQFGADGYAYWEGRSQAQRAQAAQAAVTE